MEVFINSNLRIYHMKSKLYTIKYVYWLQEISSIRQVIVYDSSNTKLQVFEWKINVFLKMSHLIWKIASSYLVVIENLTCCHMQCNNQCVRCRQTDESVNHAILNVYLLYKLELFSQHNHVSTFFLYQVCILT